MPIILEWQLKYLRVCKQEVFIFHIVSVYEHLKFHAQLSQVWIFYNLGASSRNFIFLSFLSAAPSREGYNRPSRAWKKFCWHFWVHFGTHAHSLPWCVERRIWVDAKSGNAQKTQNKVKGQLSANSCTYGTTLCVLSFIFRKSWLDFTIFSFWYVTKNNSSIPWTFDKNNRTNRTRAISKCN